MLLILCLPSSFTAYSAKLMTFTAARLVMTVCFGCRSLVGAGLSQFKSDTIGFKLPFFERFRNSEDRYSTTLLHYCCSVVCSCVCCSMRLRVQCLSFCAAESSVFNVLCN